MGESRQKYGLRIALRPSNAMEAVTYMDLKAVDEEIARATSEKRLAKFDCVNALDDELIVAYVDPTEIQMLMHHKWKRPAQLTSGPPTRPGLVQ